MKYDTISIIYQSISENLDYLKFSDNKKVFTDKTTAIVSTIVAQTINKEEEEKRVNECVKNLKDFCEVSSNLSNIKSFDEENIGVYLSFIAYGNALEKTRHKEAIVDFAVDQIYQEMDIDEEIEAESDEAEKERKRGLLEFIKGFIEEELSFFTKKDYPAYLKKLSSIINHKNKIASLLIEHIKNYNRIISKPGRMENLKRSISVGLIGSLLGFGFASIGGFGLLDILLPLAFGIGTGVAANVWGEITNKKGKVKKASKSKSNQLFDIDKDGMKLELSQFLKDQEKAISKKVDTINQDDLSKVNEIKHTYREQFVDLKVDGAMANTFHVQKTEAQKTHTEKVENKSNSTPTQGK